MSDLQISLIIIGIIVIAGVIVFNWLQQLRFRRQVEEAFKQKHDDVLFKNKVVTIKQNEKIEPQLDKQTRSGIKQNDNNINASLENNSDLEHSGNQAIPEQFQEVKENEDTGIHIIHYVITIQPNSPVTADQLAQSQQQDSDFGKPVRWFGQHQNDQQWEALTIQSNKEADNSPNYTKLKACLQLVDRSGPVSEVHLSNFRDFVYDVANQLNSTKIECPEISSAHEHAILLDKFCADVDVVIGINIISKDHGAFIGTKIRALAEASGLRLDPGGVFKYCDENDHVLFTLNNHEHDPFLAENMRNLTTHGITFLLDVPRVANGEKDFDQMTHIARIFTNTLGGIMVDDNRIPLTENGILRSKQQLSKIQSIMLSNNIPAGSANAMNLFV